VDKFPASNPFGRMLGGSSSLLTYEPYYGLREKPFSLATDPRFLYRSAEHARTFDDLLLAIRRREGLIVLTGDIGTGKTTLCKAVLEKLDRKTFTTFVPDPFITREDLLKRMLIEFGVMSVDDLKGGKMSGASHSDLSYPLYDFLKALVPLQAFAVLIIDETQNLSLPLLEEIRILSDLESPEKLMQVVLVGQLELRAKLKLPEMRQLDQRVSARCTLQALTREAVSGYIWHRLGVAGGTDDRVHFSSGAIDAVFQASGGVPRLINLICDRALYLAYLQHKNVIDAEEVARSVEDLGVGNLTAAPVQDEPQPPQAAAQPAASATLLQPPARQPATTERPAPSEKPATIEEPAPTTSAEPPAPVLQPSTPAADTSAAVPPASTPQPEPVASTVPPPAAAVPAPVASTVPAPAAAVPAAAVAQVITPLPPKTPAAKPSAIASDTIRTGMESDLSGLDVHDIPNDLHSELALSVPREAGAPFTPMLTQRTKSNRALLDESASATKWRNRALRVAIGVGLVMALMSFVVLGELMIMTYYPDPAFQVLAWPEAPPPPPTIRPAVPVDIPQELLQPPVSEPRTVVPRVTPKIE
jgi:general secretion pathway protein A